MSFEALRLEVVLLPVAARRKLMAFMVALEDQRRVGYATKLAEQIDDPSPDRWLTLEDCERKLGRTDESK